MQSVQACPVCRILFSVPGPQLCKVCYAIEGKCVWTIPVSSLPDVRKPVKEDLSKLETIANEVCRKISDHREEARDILSDFDFVIQEAEEYVQEAGGLLEELRARRDVREPPGCFNPDPDATATTKKERPS